MYLLDPAVLPKHIDALSRTARRLCGSRYDAEDLVQETFARALKRPRSLRDSSEAGYLHRALRNTYASHYRTTALQAATEPLHEDDLPGLSAPGIDPREIMEAIATAPRPFRDAVIAVDLLGLSYREAARSLRTPEATLTSRLHRGRRHVIRELLIEPM